MKLLFDENLSPKLVRELQDLFPDSMHVSQLGLQAAPDLAIWEFSAREGFTIVTADADFLNLTNVYGPPPKVIWLRKWVHPTRDAALLLRRETIRIVHFYQDPDLGIVVLDR